MFVNNSYIVLDLPEPISSIIHKIRVEQNDEYRASLPNEITVAGSSGVGPIRSGQNPDSVFEAVESVAKNFSPITAKFDKVIKFPKTDIIVLTLNDENPFIQLHKSLASSGILFDDSDYEFQPHCTLRSKSPLSNEDFERLKKLTITETFVLDTLSIYEMPPPMKLHFSTKLTG